MDNQHGGGGVDATVDPILKFIVLDGTGGLAALVIQDVAVSQTGVPHIIENVGVPGVGKHHDLTGGLDGGNQVLVLPGDVQNQQSGKVQLVIFRKIAQPAENGCVAEIGSFHKSSSFGNRMGFIPHIISHLFPGEKKSRHFLQMF